MLRRTSLDELPQLWNVLRGDMSLVGPRPTLRYQVEQYTERQRRRLEVRPGLTGWAQVHGRTSLPWSERIELDVWYVEHRSLALDVRILVRTVGVLLRREGVYKGAAGRLGRPVGQGGGVNVLLTCVGLRVDVVQAFRDAVERRGEGGVVVGTDMQELAPAAHFCDRFERMPIATDPGYADRPAGARRAPRRALRRAVLRVRPDRPGRHPRALPRRSAPRSSSPTRGRRARRSTSWRWRASSTPAASPRRAPSRPTSCPTTCASRCS